MRGVWFEKNIDYENVSINEFVIMNLVLVSINYQLLFDINSICN